MPSAVSVLTGFTFEFSLAVSQASAAHHVAIFCTAVPLFTNAIVVAIVMAPLWRRRSRDRRKEKGKRKGRERIEQQIYIRESVRVGVRKEINSSVYVK